MFTGYTLGDDHVARVEVKIGGKTEMRTIESIDSKTGQIMPVHADHELVAHTVCGQIIIIPNAVPPDTPRFADDDIGHYDNWDEQGARG